MDEATEEPEDRAGVWAVTTGGNMHSRFAPRHAVPPAPFPFTDEQKQSLVEAVYEAQLAVLQAIVREAGRPESYDGPRNLLRLTTALRGLGPLAGTPGHPGRWFGHPPFIEDEIGSHVIIGDDDDDDDDL